MSRASGGFYKTRELTRFCSISDAVCLSAGPENYVRLGRSPANSILIKCSRPVSRATTVATCQVCGTCPGPGGKKFCACCGYPVAGCPGCPCAPALGSCVAT